MPLFIRLSGNYSSFISSLFSFGCRVRLPGVGVVLVVVSTVLVGGTGVVSKRQVRGKACELQVARVIYFMISVAGNKRIEKKSERYCRRLCVEE